MLQLLAAHGVAAEAQVDSMLRLIPRNLQLLKLEDVQQLSEGLQAADASSDSIQRVLGAKALPGYSWEHHNSPKLKALIAQLGLTADQAVDALARHKSARTSSGWVEHVLHHQGFLDVNVLQDGRSLRQLLIDKPGRAMPLLAASPATMQSAAAYRQDKLGWSREELASRVVRQPIILARSVNKLAASVQSICNTFGVSVAEVGKLAARQPRLLGFKPSTLEQAAEAVVKVMGSTEAAW